MIVSERFAFLHLHKSGGTFVNEFLLRFVAGARQVGYHLPRKLLPLESAALPVLGFVRNPWSYYVSWYTFQSRRKEPNALFRILSNEGRLGFEPTVANMLALGTTGRLLDEVIRALPDHYAHRGLNLPSFELEGIRASMRGFYSFLYHHIYDGPGIMYIGRTDRLRAELASMLVAVGQSVTQQMRTYIESATMRNVSAHEHYVNYYGEETRELVAECDRDIIQRYAFVFGD